MKTLIKVCSRLPFALLALPRVVFLLFQREARVSYLRWLHPRVHFSASSYADDASCFEDGVRILPGAIVSNSSIGMFSYVGNASSVMNCTIGRYCSIGPQVMIGLGIHPVAGMISTYPAFYSASKHAVNFRVDRGVREYKPIVIGHDVWIGARVIIRDGVTIGNGAIIAAGSVVTKDVECYTIVGGVPARVIRGRFNAEDAKLLEEFAWWNRGVGFCRKHAALFADAPTFIAEMRSGRLDQTT